MVGPADPAGKPPSVAVGRKAYLSVEAATAGQTGWQREARETVAVRLDDPAAGRILPGQEETDAFVVPARAGDTGATVTWTQVSTTDTNADGTAVSCKRSEHTVVHAVVGKAPPATILGDRTGDYELNTLTAGMRPSDCLLAGFSYRIVPARWVLHWTTTGSRPSRDSPTLSWTNKDPCPDLGERSLLSGPRRVGNRFFVANRTAGTVELLPAFPARSLRGWWEVRVGDRIVKSVRFRWVHGTGYRTFPGGRAKITGVTLQHDTGPCPGVEGGCTSWVPRPTRKR